MARERAQNPAPGFDELSNEAVTASLASEHTLASSSRRPQTSRRHRNRPRPRNSRSARNPPRLSSPEAPELRGAPPSTGLLVSASWTALGTGIVLRVTDPAALAPARAAVELELGAIDRACSRFREDS